MKTQSQASDTNLEYNLNVNPLSLTESLKFQQEKVQSLFLNDITLSIGWTIGRERFKD